MNEIKGRIQSVTVERSAREDIYLWNLSCGSTDKGDNETTELNRPIAPPVTWRRERGKGEFAARSAPFLTTRISQTRFFLQFRSAALFPPKSPGDRQASKVTIVSVGGVASNYLSLRKRITRSTCSLQPNPNDDGYRTSGAFTWAGEQVEGEGEALFNPAKMD